MEEAAVCGEKDSRLQLLHVAAMSICLLEDLILLSKFQVNIKTSYNDFFVLKKLVEWGSGCSSVGRELA